MLTKSRCASQLVLRTLTLVFGLTFLMTCAQPTSRPDSSKNANANFIAGHVDPSLVAEINDAISVRQETYVIIPPGNPAAVEAETKAAAVLAGAVERRVDFYHVQLISDETAPIAHYGFFPATINMAAQYYALETGDLSVEYGDLVQQHYLTFTDLGVDPRSTVGDNQNYRFGRWVLTDIGSTFWKSEVRKTLFLSFSEEWQNARAEAVEVPLPFAADREFFEIANLDAEGSIGTLNREPQGDCACKEDIPSPVPSEMSSATTDRGSSTPFCCWWKIKFEDHPAGTKGSKRWCCPCTPTSQICCYSEWRCSEDGGRVALATSVFYGDCSQVPEGYESCTEGTRIRFYYNYPDGGTLTWKDWYCDVGPCTILDPECEAWISNQAQNHNQSGLPAVDQSIPASIRYIDILCASGGMYI